MHVLQLGDKQKICTMHHSTEYDICFRTHIGKGGVLCTSTTVTCHTCLVLHHSLHAIDSANACQWPLEWSSFHYTSPSMFRNHACHVAFFEGGQLDFFEGGQLSVRSHLAPRKATCLGCQAACHQYPASLGCLPL